jgi:hypothetical protein
MSDKLFLQDVDIEIAAQANASFKRVCTEVACREGRAKQTGRGALHARVGEFQGLATRRL